MLEKLLASETDRIEWKSSSRDTDEVLRAVCALANDLGSSGTAGHLLIGVDKKGAAVGTLASDEEIQRLANRLTSTRLLPNPSVDVEVGEWQGKPVLIV